MSTTKKIPNSIASLVSGTHPSDAGAIRDALLNWNEGSSTYGITAKGTNALTATKLASVFNQIDTVNSAGGVNLPLSTGKRNTPCQICFIVNNTSSVLTVYGYPNSSDTINGGSGGTGISIAGNASVIFVSAEPGSWSQSGSARNAAQTGAQPAYQIVGTRTGMNGAGGQLSGAGNESRIRHCLPYGAQEIILVYAGFTVTTSNPDKELPMPPGNGFKAISVVLSSGTGYAVGDTVQFTVASGAFSPTVSIDAVSGGVPSAWSVIEGGLFASIPAASLAQSSTSGTGTDVTATFTCQAYAYGLQIGLEQVWGTQTAFSTSALTGVYKVSSGATNQGIEANLFLPMGDNVATDPIQNNWAPGSFIGTRIQTPGNLLPVGRVLSGSLGLNEESHASIAAASAPPWGGTYPSRTNPAAGFQPIYILGKVSTPAPSFIFIGDSIAYGTYSLPSGGTTTGALDINGNDAWIEQAANQQVAWSNFSAATDRLSNWLAQGTSTTGAALRMRAIALANPSHILDELGINDAVGGSASFATLMANKITFWSWLKGIGVKEIWAPTLTPNPTSTNGLSSLPVIAAGGTGYAVNSTFNVTIAGGTQSLGAGIVSVSTNGSGVVTTVNSIVNIGYYTANPSLTNSPTGGTGTGLSLTITLAKCLDQLSQSVNSANACIQSWNSWLRAGNAAQYGVTRILDLGLDVESIVGNGLWPSGASFDALHPTMAQHAIIASHQMGQFATATL